MNLFKLADSGTYYVRVKINKKPILVRYCDMRCVISRDLPRPTVHALLLKQHGDGTGYAETINRLPKQSKMDFRRATYLRFPSGQAD
jgi:hypothetical protein